MKKLFVLVVVSFGLICSAAWGRDITVCNMTNSPMSNPTRPTSIMFNIINARANGKIANPTKKMNNLLLKPGQKIVINADQFPFEASRNELFVKFNNTCGHILLGVEDLGNGNIGLENFGIHALSNTFEPYYSVKTDTRGNIKEIDFFYANTFFSA